MSKSIYCLDTNIVAASLVKERLTPKARKLIKSIKNQASIIVEPSLLIAEIYSVLRKQESLGYVKITPDYFEAFAAFDFQYVSVGLKKMNQAFRFAQELELRVVYDCIFLVTAMHYQASFVTEDQQFLEKAKLIYDQAFSLNQALSSGDFK